jgi:hypothetical protein
MNIPGRDIYSAFRSLGSGNLNLLNPILWAWKNFEKYSLFFKLLQRQAECGIYTVPIWLFPGTKFAATVSRSCLAGSLSGFCVFFLEKPKFSRSKSFPRIRFYGCPGVQKLCFYTAASPGYPCKNTIFALLRKLFDLLKLDQYV